MSSNVSPIPFDANPSGESLTNSDCSSDKDEICNICNKWCNDLDDFEISFLSCATCINSYHKRCIPIIYHTEDESYNCYEMRNKTTNKLLKCCHTNRKPLLLYEIIGNKFNKTNYFYNSNGIKINYNPNYDNIKHQLFINKNNDSQIFTRTQCNEIKYKGIKYHIGDSIEVKSDSNQQYHTKVAIIREIYVCDEPNSLPEFNIYWYLREKEIDTNLYNNSYNKNIKLLEIKNRCSNELELKYISSNLYIDISCNETINIGLVLYKVIICNNFNNFYEFNGLKFKEFGNVFYCNCSFTIENYTKYNSSPFENINMKQFKNKLIELNNKNKNNKNKNKLKNKSKYKSKEKVEKYLQKYNNEYIIGNDEYKCMDLNIPFTLKQKQNNKYEIKIPLQKGKKLIMDEIHNNEQIITHNNNNNNNKKTKKKTPIKKKDILAKNKKNITISDQDKMKNICKLLGIFHGMKIDINLYGFATHLEVYNKLLYLIKMNSSIRNNNINDMNGQQLRDIKSKLKSEGKCGRRIEMVNGICKKLNELKIYYDKNENKYNDKLEKDYSDIDDDIPMDELINKPCKLTKKNKKRPRFDLYHQNGNNNNVKRRRIDKR